MPIQEPFHPLYIAFFREYHKKQYWEAHEVLEELWQTERDNDFYHGLIQIAAIMHQLERGKIRGARKLATTATSYLAKFIPTYQGVSVTQVLTWLENLLQQLPTDSPRLSMEEVQELKLTVCPLPWLH